MVRKTTRSSMKAAEQSSTDSPRRGRTKTSSRQKRSPSKSDDSEDDTPLILNKSISPNQADKASSENESDTDSKKPLKKRTRSMAIKEQIQQSSSPSKSRWDKQPKTQTSKNDLKDTNEEVKEDQNLKGKSKNINNSNNDNVVDPETETENVQVTDESPTDAKDNHENQIKNGQESKEMDNSKSKTGEADIVSNENSSEQAKVVESQNDPLELMQEKTSEIPSKETNDTVENVHKSKDSNIEPSDVKEEKNSDRRLSEQSSEVKAENEQNEKSEEKSKKIKLKRPSGDKHISESDDKEKKTEENGTKKKITLKRLENKPVLSEEAKQEENHNSPPKDQPQTEEWTSIYESKSKDVDKHEKTEGKPSRRRITLKRPTVKEKGLVLEKNVDNDRPKKEVSLDRSISLPEHVNERRKSIVESTTPEGKRRRSSAFERPTSENEGKAPTPKKPTKVVKLVRTIPKETQEPPPPGEETLKKYKWGKSEHSCPNIKIVNLEDLKQVCSTIEFLKEEDVNLDIVVKEHKIPIKERRKTFTELEAEEMEKIEAELNAEPEEIEIKENIIAMNRKISIVDDTASKMKPPPSPARNPVSEVLFISNLVRPFTVKQLKELLERTGKIKVDGFWTDRIKSKCYVCYETSEEAEATRNALHGVNWPIGNGKKLMIDYATVEDLTTAKNPPIAVKKEKTPEKENKKPIIVVEDKDEISSKHTKREWNQEKDDHRRRRSRSRSKDRQRKHSRRSYTPEDYHSKKRKHEEPPPQKAMDDLFLKTKATPSIYWQPLSPEEIALKQQQRQVRLEENKRRLEEISRTAPRGGTYRDRGRDRNFRRR